MTLQETTRSVALTTRYLEVNTSSRRIISYNENIYRRKRKQQILEKYTLSENEWLITENWCTEGKG